MSRGLSGSKPTLLFFNEWKILLAVMNGWGKHWEVRTLQLTSNVNIGPYKFSN
jgi:hypothetical protein